MAESKHWLPAADLFPLTVYSQREGFRLVQFSWFMFNNRTFYFLPLTVVLCRHGCFVSGTAGTDCFSTWRKIMLCSFLVQYMQK